ncbi:MAG: DegV family protein [Eubacterium sp.]|nr:DegV family protein [Eubacterium sp.]
MAEFILSCCSTVDLTPEYMEKRDIKYICFNYSVDGVAYKDDMGVSIKTSELHKRMLEGADAKTSQVSVGEYVEYFTSYLNEGKDILHCTLSSGISGTYNSACTAADILKEQFPDRKIYIVDSLEASSGYGLFMDKLADLKEEGMDIDTLKNWAEENRLNVNHWFFSSDLTFFIRGGRVSKTAGAIGKVLSICPILNVDHMGRLISREKIRTKKKAILRAAEKMEELAYSGLEYSDKVFISNSDPEGAKALADLIAERFPKIKGKVEIFDIGATIGCHTGPGTVALFFWGKKRED